VRSLLVIDATTGQNGLAQARAFHEALELDGIVLTMFDPRSNLAQQVADEVKAHFHVYKTVVPRNVRLSEAPSHGKPVLLYDLRCPGTKSYLAVADEFLDRTLMIEVPGPRAEVSS
jgi:chromosome partitioning protein